MGTTEIVPVFWIRGDSSVGLPDRESVRRQYLFRLTIQRCCRRLSEKSTWYSRTIIAAVLFLAAFCATAFAADTVAVLPLFNQNEANAGNLDWIGESVAETIHGVLTSAGSLVLARDDRAEVYRRLAVRPEAILTKATVIKIGEALDAGEVVFGEFKVDSPETGATNLQSNLRLTLRVIDLKRMREAPAMESAGPLNTLSQLQMKLAWMVLKQLSPGSAPSEDEFLRERPAVRVDAMESYVRGLMASNPDQKMKFFSQAVRLDEHFSQPNFQLGRILFLKKDYKGAPAWLAKVVKTDSHFMEASFLLGICNYYSGDFDSAIRQLKMVLAELPLNEVYNDLGAALSRKGDSTSLYNFQKALEGDEADPDYWFNVGYSYWKLGQFAQAADRFRAVLDRSQNDQEATTMLGRCLKMEGPRQGDPKGEGRERIKTTFEDSAFRQLQAELKTQQSKP